MTADLLEILACPATRQPLKAAPADLIENLNKQIARRSLKTCCGEIITDPIDAALLREDRKIAYVIRNEIPILLRDESIAL
jgi:uncharacterized protein YbaR (Trm112 family)